MVLNVLEHCTGVSFVGVHFVVVNEKEFAAEHDMLDDSEQREVLSWFKKNRPEMWRDIFCDDYPEATK